MVVSTLEAAPVREAQYFIEVLRSKRFHLGALVLNRVLPDYLLEPGEGAAAGRLVSGADELAGRLAPEVDADPVQLCRVLTEVGDNYRNFRVVAKAEAEQRRDLATIPDVVVTAPELDADIHDLAGLLRLGALIWS